MGTVRGDRADALPLAQLQVLGQAPGIGVDRPGCPPQISPDPQPPGGLVVPAQDGPLLLQYDGAQRPSSATGQTVPDMIARPVRFQVTDKKIAFHMRTPSWCRRRAAEVGPACAALIGGLLEDNALYRLRAAQGVLHLADKHQPGRLEAACAKAAAAGDPSYRTVKGILAAGTEQDPVTMPAGDGGAAAFLHGPRALFAAAPAGNVVALHPGAPGAEAAAGPAPLRTRPPRRPPRVNAGLTPRPRSPATTPVTRPCAR